MTASPFRFEPLSNAHDRTLFRCGEEPLDRYFQTQATQDIRRHIAHCFVAVETRTGQVAAYYTLSAASIPLMDLPPEEAKRLPRYPTLPAVRIGRLAVDQRFQSRGLGAASLMDAAHRTLQAAVSVKETPMTSNSMVLRRHSFWLVRKLLQRYCPPGVRDRVAGCQGAFPGVGVGGLGI